MTAELFGGQGSERTGAKLIPLDVVEKLVILDLLDCRPRFGVREKPEDARRSVSTARPVSSSRFTTHALINDSAAFDTDEAGGKRKLS